MTTGYIVFAHGSRLEAANESVRTAATQMSQQGGFDRVEVAFLDCVPPDLVTCIGRLAQGGVQRVVVIPYFLMPGRHTAEDLPRLVANASRIYKQVKIDVTDTLDGHPALGAILLERARQL